MKPSKPARNVVTAEDRQELQRHYKFVLPKEQQNNGTWQERMVQRYHQDLYKEFAIADLSVPSRIGLRFRTKPEVVSGKGYETCGNKHCPSYWKPDQSKNKARDNQSVVEVGCIRSCSSETTKNKNKKQKNISFLAYGTVRG